MDRIKRLSKEILAQHQTKFGGDFTENKKILDQVSIIRSKGLKNEIAGYITKLIKKEQTNKKLQEELAARHVEEQNQDLELVEETEYVEEQNEVSADVEDAPDSTGQEESEKTE